MNRDDLVKVAMRTGLTYRESRRLVRELIKEMTAILLRGEDLDLPFCTIHPSENKERGVRKWRLRQIVVMKKKKFRFHVRQKSPWK